MRKPVVIALLLMTAGSAAGAGEADDLVAKIEDELRQGVVHLGEAYSLLTNNLEIIGQDLDACRRAAELFSRVDVPFPATRSMPATAIHMCADAAANSVRKDDVPGRIEVVRLYLLASNRYARAQARFEEQVVDLRRRAVEQAEDLSRRDAFEELSPPRRVDALLGIIELVELLDREGLEEEANTLRERTLERQAEAQAAAEEAGEPAAHARAAAAAVDCGLLLLRTGEIDAARKLAAKGEEALRAIAAAEGAPAEAHLELARALCFRARLDRDRAEACLKEAHAECERAREAGDDSGEFYLRLGQASLLGAELLQEKLAAAPRDKELAKAADAALRQAFDAFKEGLEVEEENLALKSAYNECLWQMMRRIKGRARGKPVMESHLASAGGLRFSLPVSEAWDVGFPFRFDGCVFEAHKVEKEAGRVLALRIYRYDWDTNYRVPETGQLIGGENISGLAELHEDEIREAFEDVKERIPLEKFRLSRKVKKAHGFAVKRLTKGKGAFEWRSIFFKHPKAEATYEIVVFASLGLLDRNPWELESILETFETVVPR